MFEIKEVKLVFHNINRNAFRWSNGASEGFRPNKLDRKDDHQKNIIMIAE